MEWWSGSERMGIVKKGRGEEDCLESERGGGMGTFWTLRGQEVKGWEEGRFDPTLWYMMGVWSSCSGGREKVRQGAWKRVG